MIDAGEIPAQVALEDIGKPAGKIGNWRVDTLVRRANGGRKWRASRLVLSLFIGGTTGVSWLLILEVDWAGVNRGNTHGFEIFAEGGDGGSGEFVGGLFGDAQRGTYFAVALAITDAFSDFDFGMRQAGDVGKLACDFSSEGKDLVHSFFYDGENLAATTLGRQAPYKAVPWVFILENLKTKNSAAPSAGWKAARSGVPGRRR